MGSLWKVFVSPFESICKVFKNPSEAHRKPFVSSWEPFGSIIDALLTILGSPLEVFEGLCGSLSISNMSIISRLKNTATLNPEATFSDLFVVLCPSKGTVGVSPLVHKKINISAMTF